MEFYDQSETLERVPMKVDVSTIAGKRMQMVFELSLMRTRTLMFCGIVSWVVNRDRERAPGPAPGNESKLMDFQ